MLGRSVLLGRFRVCLSRPLRVHARCLFAEGFMGECVEKEQRDTGVRNDLLSRVWPMFLMFEFCDFPRYFRALQAGYR